MRFANNIEQMAYDKSGWSLIETSADGKYIYMGKPKTETALPDEPVWFIKRIVTIEGKDGSQTIEIKYGPKNSKWDERENLTYKYFWS